MTHIVVISDTHGLHRSINIPSCDLLIHAGDFSNIGGETDIRDFLVWFSGQPARNKVYIAGNHDLAYDRSPSFKQKMIDEFPNLHYLENSCIKLDRWVIYGSPNTPEFMHWAFMKKRGFELQEHWSRIPMYVNILVTHGPMFRIHDKCLDGCVGDSDLRDRVDQLQHLNTHICGHIHEGYGTKLRNNVDCINASICDGQYHPVNKPIEITI